MAEKNEDTEGQGPCVGGTQHSPGSPETVTNPNTGHTVTITKCTKCGTYV